MKITNINSENDLREWLREHSVFMRGVELQWVESSLYGGSVGSADVIMKCGDNKVDVELKYLYRTKKGLKYTLRPSQRRFHRMSMARGSRTCLLAIEDDTKHIFLMRGDHVPLRDYVSDPNSGCNGGENKFVVTGSDTYVAITIMALLFDDETFWPITVIA